jgi:hypothetical protein
MLKRVFIVSLGLIGSTALSSYAFAMEGNPEPENQPANTPVRQDTTRKPTDSECLPEHMLTKLHKLMDRFPPESERFPSPDTLSAEEREKEWTKVVNGGHSPYFPYIHSIYSKEEQADQGEESSPSSEKQPN